MPPVTALGPVHVPPARGRRIRQADQVYISPVQQTKQQRDIPMISAHDKEIQALVSDVRDGKLLLPELQRSYVWKSPQVRDLFDSLYHQYPSGQLLPYFCANSRVFYSQTQTQGNSIRVFGQK